MKSIIKRFLHSRYGQEDISGISKERLLEFAGIYGLANPERLRKLFPNDINPRAVEEFIKTIPKTAELGELVLRNDRVASKAVSLLPRLCGNDLTEIPNVLGVGHKEMFVGERRIGSDRFIGIDYLYTATLCGFNELFDSVFFRSHGDPNDQTLLASLAEKIEIYQQFAKAVSNTNTYWAAAIKYVVSEQFVSPTLQLLFLLLHECAHVLQDYRSFDSAVAIETTLEHDNKRNWANWLMEWDADMRAWAWLKNLKLGDFALGKHPDEGFDLALVISLNALFIAMASLESAKGKSPKYPDAINRLEFLRFHIADHPSFAPPVASLHEQFDPLMRLLAGQNSEESTFYNKPEVASRLRDLLLTTHGSTKLQQGV